MTLKKVCVSCLGPKSSLFLAQTHLAYLYLLWAPHAVFSHIGYPVEARNTESRWGPHGPTKVTLDSLRSHLWWHVASWHHAINTNWLLKTRPFSIVVACFIAVLILIGERKCFSQYSIPLPWSLLIHSLITEVQLHVDEWTPNKLIQLNKSDNITFPCTLSPQNVRSILPVFERKNTKLSQQHKHNLNVIPNGNILALLLMYSTDRG